MYIIVAPLCYTFLKRADFYKAFCSEKRGVLWLASYPVRCDWPNTSSVSEMLRPSPYCNAVSRRDKTKTIKPSLNEAFVASSEDIITDYNDSYSVLRIANKHCSTLPKTHTWIVSSKFFKNRNVLTDCESEAPDCPCDIGIAPLYSVHRHS